MDGISLEGLPADSGGASRRGLIILNERLWSRKAVVIGCVQITLMEKAGNTYLTQITMVVELENE